MFNFIRKIFKRKKVTKITDVQFIESEIRRFKTSKRRNDIIQGNMYYNGLHDILRRNRTVIGEGGKLVEVSNLVNNKIVDNQYKKMVDQKNNYLLGQPISFQCENDEYSKCLNYIFNKKFLRLLKNLGEDSLNSGLGWLFVCYDENGELSFRRFKPHEIIAGWKDEEHTVLDYAIRVYEVVVHESKKEKVIEKVEVYDDKGITYFELNKNGRLEATEPFHKDYITFGDDSYNWTKIPLIPFKYNSKEIPLIKMVKSLQDGINTILSNFQNQMEEDPRNTILVLVNYDGQNLGEFRKNLATYGAVKVKTVDGGGGDLKTLQVEVNSQNYEVILKMFKKAIIENCMGYDAKDDRLSGNPNQMNIQSMYSDIDLDANNMETEYQASFEDLLWFVNMHLFNIGLGDFENEQLEVIFNRDIMISESEVIENCTKSTGILSNESIIANHPWVNDPQKELERIASQKQKEIEQYESAFNSGGDDDKQ